MGHWDCQSDVFVWAWSVSTPLGFGPAETESSDWLEIFSEFFNNSERSGAFTSSASFIKTWEISIHCEYPVSSCISSDTWKKCSQLSCTEFSTQPALSGVVEEIWSNTSSLGLNVIYYICYIKFAIS